MVHCNESSQADTGGVAPVPLTRAGLRRPPRSDEPTAVFVVIEVAVLCFVSALAMVSIIVSIDDGEVGRAEQRLARVDARTASVQVARGVLATPAAYVDDGATSSERAARRPSTAPAAP